MGFKESPVLGRNLAGGRGFIDIGADADMSLCCTVKLRLPQEHFGVTHYSSTKVVPSRFVAPKKHVVTVLLQPACFSLHIQTQSCDTMKVAIVFVLLFATVLCRPARKPTDASSESSEEVVSVWRDKESQIQRGFYTY